MNLTARNVLQNKLGIDRVRVDWLAEQLTEHEAEILSDPRGVQSADVVGVIAADCVKRIESTLRPTP
ncbi:MAG: hypothetical protein AB7G28_25130 [Pirellulales bacterium]